MGTESGIRNMTAGSPFRHILMFTLPLLAGNFLQQFYNMVDSWVVGNFVSDGALAAVGVGFPVIFLFTSLFSGIATGGTVVIAQAPLAELTDYSTRLRSITRGTGDFTMKPAGYEQVPYDVQAKLVERYEEGRAK